MGATLSPELMVTFGKLQSPKMISKATDFISSAIPSTALAPNLPGLAGRFLFLKKKAILFYKPIYRSIEYAEKDKKCSPGKFVRYFRTQ
jgi:hypothetical protein